jgi:hypothetical protein
MDDVPMWMGFYNADPRYKPIFDRMRAMKPHQLSG